MQKIILIAAAISISVFILCIFLYIFYYKNPKYFWEFLIISLPIAVAIVLAAWQISSSVDLFKKQQEINRLNEVQGKAALLKCLQQELQNNLKDYVSSLLPIKDDLINGHKKIHFLEYSTTTLVPNLLNNTFVYNTELQQRVINIYAMLEESNRIFQLIRNGGVEENKIREIYAYIFDKHEKLKDGWMRAVNDIGELSNNYEPMSVMLDKQAVKHGTTLNAIIDAVGRSILIFNYGGEGAEKIKLTIKLFNYPEEEYVRDVPYLKKQNGVTFALFTPRYFDKDLSGLGTLEYSSEHSNGIKKLSFDIKWDAVQKKWIQVLVPGEITNKIKTFQVGSIFDTNLTYPARVARKEGMLNLLDGEGGAITIKNTGEVPIIKLTVVNQYGQLNDWRDYEAQKILEPNDSLTIPIPLPSSQSESTLSGSIIFQYEGSENLMYKLFSYKWEGDRTKWVDAFKNR